VSPEEGEKCLGGDRGQKKGPEERAGRETWNMVIPIATLTKESGAGGGEARKSGGEITGQATPAISVCKLRSIEVEKLGDSAGLGIGLGKKNPTRRR